MKSSRIVALFAALTGVVALASSCGLFDTGPKRFKFIVPVDTFVVPDTVKSTDTLLVGIRGVIAFDGCAQFEELKRTRTGGTITYTVYALHDDGRICVQGLILFNRIDTVLPPQINPTVISAVQPSGSFPVTRTVVVK